MSSSLQLKMETKIGPLFLVASEKGLQVVFWKRQDIPMVDVKTSKGSAAQILLKAELQLQEYLSGTRRKFDLPLDPVGTAFQKSVWKKLVLIPYGEKRAYKEIAAELGSPTASRAVGTANGKNPLCLIIPCHRVVAADGSLGGYSGGLDIKAQLLDLEMGALGR